MNRATHTRMGTQCHATDSPHKIKSPGPSMAIFVAMDGPPGPSMAATDDPPGPSTAP